MELDDRKPQNMAIAVDPQVERGTAEIEVVASVTPPPTMKEVTFIVGITKVTDADFDKAEQEGKTIKGVSPDDGRSWTGEDQGPRGRGRQASRSPRASRPSPGSRSSYTTEVNVVDPAAAAKDKAKAAMEPPKPGSIEGTVTIAGRPQPDQTRRSLLFRYQDE